MFSCRSAERSARPTGASDNTNFGLSPDDPDGYLLQRYLFHVDFPEGRRFRLFGELSSSLENGGRRPWSGNFRLVETQLRSIEW